MPQTLSLTASCTSSAAFRAWGSAISTALATNGQVQTADTGQINWTTVAAAATSTAAGYEIWKFNDALQSTAPIVFKLEYGTGASTSAPQMWITVGTGSDGAGTITGTNITNVLGALTARRAVGPTGSSAAAGTGNVYINGDAGCLALLGWPALNSSYGGLLLLIERQRLWDGTTSSDGYALLTSANAGNDATVAYSQVCYLPNLVTNASNTSTTFAGPLTSAGLGPLSAVIANTMYPQHVPISGGVRAGAPSQYVMAICPGDFPAGSTFSMSHYGTSRTWISLGVGCGSNVGFFGVWGLGNLKSFIFRTT